MRRILLTLCLFGLLAGLAAKSELDLPAVMVYGKAGEFTDSLKLERDLSKYWQASPQNYTWRPRFYSPTMADPLRNNYPLWRGNIALAGGLGNPFAAMARYKDPSTALLVGGLDFNYATPEDDWYNWQLGLWATPVYAGVKQNYAFKAGSWASNLDDTDTDAWYFKAGGSYNLNRFKVTQIKLALGLGKVKQSGNTYYHNEQVFDFVLNAEFEKLYQDWQPSATIAHTAQVGYTQLQAVSKNILYFSSLGVWLAADTNHLYLAPSFSSKLFSVGRQGQVLVNNAPQIITKNSWQHISSMPWQYSDNNNRLVKKPIAAKLAYKHGGIIPFSLWAGYDYRLDWAMFYRTGSGLYGVSYDDITVPKAGIDAAWQQGNFSLAANVLVQDPTAVDADFVPWLPQVEAALHADYSTDLYKAGLELTHASGAKDTTNSTMPDCWQLNANTSYLLYRNLELNCTAANLLNRANAVYRGVPVSGLSVVVGLNYLF